MQSQIKPRPGEEVDYCGERYISSRVLQGIQALPTLPQVLTSILSTMEDENASASDLERAIRQDQALSSKLLAVANSSYYGWASQITTLKRAVVVLGMAEVRKICLGAGIFNLLSRSRVKNFKLVEEQWVHSLAVAEGARTLALSTRKVDPEQAFTGGLLHDLGRLAMATFFPDEMEAVARLAAAEDISLHEAEGLLGVDHEDLGIFLAEHWRLPPMLSEVMGRHHEPHPDLAFLELVAVVHVADCLVHGIWSQDQTPRRDPYPEALRALDLGGDDLQLVRLRLRKRAQAIDSLRRNLMNPGP